MTRQSPDPAGNRHDLLQGSRVYLSGPMDFVESRAKERADGWRNRVSDFLVAHGVTTFDPWYKPLVKGLGVRGEEDETSDALRHTWTFESDEAGARTRARCAQTFWDTLHIDLRMVDLSDFLVAYCPTHIYSVGTPHEIALARQQRKPVLFVSPPVHVPALARLRAKAASDPELAALLEELSAQAPIRENPRGVPSLWYMALVGSESFFDGFGFERYAARFGWRPGALDEAERRTPPRRPLLPFLERLAHGELPCKWDRSGDRLVENDDWLLLDLACRHRAPGAPAS